MKSKKKIIAIIACLVIVIAAGIFFGVKYYNQKQLEKKLDDGIALIESYLEDYSSKETKEEKSASFAPLAMLLLAIATSVDALAVGVAFAMDNVNIALAAPIIGVATFLLSALGLRIGSVFGLRYKNKAEFAGGLVLVLIGVKILLEHLGVISF